jgi:MFS family permease
VFAVVAAGTFMATLDSSIVNVALPTLARTFHAPVTTIEWVPLAYLLSLTLLLLPFGRLADALGRRRIYLAGIGLFTIGSALCAAAPSLALLVAARIVQGVGAAMVSANGIAIVTTSFPAEIRGRALGWIGATVGIGLTVGPPLGGWLIELGSWRTIFLVNLPIGIVLTAAGVSLLPRDERAAAGGTAAARREPLVDLGAFRNPVFASSIATLFLAFVALFAAVFLVPFYLERVAGQTPGEVGRVLVVIPLLLSLVSPVSGALSDRVGSRALTTFGLLVTGAGLLLLAAFIGYAPGRSPGLVAVLGSLFVVGLGQGLFQPPNSSAAMGAVPSKRLGFAGGLLATMRNLGMLCGIGLAAAVYEGRELAHIGRVGGGAIEATGVSGAAAALGVRDALLVAAAIAILASFVALARGAEPRRGDTLDAPRVAR